MKTFSRLITQSAMVENWTEIQKLAREPNQLFVLKTPLQHFGTRTNFLRLSVLELLWETEFSQTNIKNDASNIPKQE